MIKRAILLSGMLLVLGLLIEWPSIQKDIKEDKARAQLKAQVKDSCDLVFTQYALDQKFEAAVKEAARQDAIHLCEYMLNCDPYKRDVRSWLAHLRKNEILMRCTIEESRAGQVDWPLVMALAMVWRQYHEPKMEKV